MAIDALRESITSSLPLRDPHGEIDTPGERRLTERLNRIGETAAAMVEREAPGAPQPIKNEAVVRFAGYLFYAAWGEKQSQSLGPRSTEFVTNHAPMFRNCGAKGLLSFWKVRRAGAIG